QYAIDVAHRLAAGWITWLCYAVIAGAGLFFFTLYCFDRTQTYLLWASFTWLGLALLRLDEFLLAASIHFPSRIEIVLYGIGNLQAFFYANLFFSLAGRKLPRWFRFIVGFLLVEGLLIVLASFLPTRAALTLRYWTDIATTTQVVIIPMFVLTSFAPLVAFWPVWKIQRSQAALVVVSFFWMVMDAVYLGLQMPGLPVNPFFFLRFQAARSVAIAATVVALTLLLVQRLRTTNRERAALAGEMQAAREIQRLLVPPFIDMAPGMRIEAAYLPAKELGGDFYRCRILPSGAQRLLLGDVSGKGAAAALTAAMLLGAAEGHDADSPAALLQHLNAVLLCSRVGGFATCLCAEVSPQGLITLANAGHLAPYRNGDEIPLDSGLPLGITLDSPYTESSATLAPSETLTFISDGVVEARNPSGELYGFERTRSISSNSAERIAHAAQQFGQQDDITVLTLTFAPAPVSAGVLHA
ncbi:MAG: PP2C family protein-serine/threonine phosphatase, partial [Acidobacteriaceae bacterium]